MNAHAEPSEGGPMPSEPPRIIEGTQCARCGSSTDWADCWNCGGEGFVEENWGDDSCEELHDVPCMQCLGTGGQQRCMSSDEYCHAHPLPGREETPCGTIETWSVEVSTPPSETRHE